MGIFRRLQDLTGRVEHLAEGAAGTLTGRDDTPSSVDGSAAPPPDTDAGATAAAPQPETAAPPPAAPESGTPVTVLGLFASMDDASIALNNLDEADYSPASISVLTNDPARTRSLTDVRGPLSGTSLRQLPRKLAALGLARDACRAYRARVAAGDVCIVVAAPRGSESSAAEILADQHGQQVQILGGGAAG